MITSGPVAYSGISLPLFGELSEPLEVMRLAAEAEAAGFDGVFVWDHLWWRSPVTHVGDPWITLAAMATATETVRLGPMVSALPRRRPAKVARETITLDRLSRGRLVLGAGIGEDRFGKEFTTTGEELDDRVRGEMLDESLNILTAAWAGDTIHHRGQHFTISGAQFLPRPVQQPTIPVWIAGFRGNARPMRRAARFNGFFPVNLEHPDQLAQVVDSVTALRHDPAAPYDFVVSLPVGVDAGRWQQAGATWCLSGFDPERVSLDQVRGVLRDGPPTR